MSFHLISSDGSIGTAQSGGTEVWLIPFRTAAVFPFSFPFGRKVNLRSAVALNFRSVLGDEEAKLSLIPQVTEQRSNLTRGAAWFAAKDEISEYEERLGKNAVFLPAPAAFVSEIGGDGLVVWQEERVACALWMKEYTPQLYRCISVSDGGAEGLAKWMRSYAAASGGDIPPENVRFFYADDMSAAELNRIASASFAAAPGLSSLDMSNRGASLVERYESFFSTAFQCLRIASVMGFIFLALALVVLGQNKYNASHFASAPGDVYMRAIGEPSRSPLSSITKELRLVTGDGVQLTLGGTLANIAAAWKTLPKNNSVKLDAVRYGAERTELEGQAQKTDDIQQLRDALSKNGFSVRLGDVQQIPGGGMRFAINLTEGGRSR